MTRLCRQLWFLVRAFLYIPTQAKNVKLKGAVYSPEVGVICDKKAGFCADSEHSSVALTKMEPGEKVEKKLMECIKPEPGVQDNDTATFVLTHKVACDGKAKKCKVSKFEDKIDAAHTKAQFGKSPFSQSIRPVAVNP